MKRAKTGIKNRKGCFDLLFCFLYHFLRPENTLFCPHGYTYANDSCLYYLQSRYYDPELGRFINADSYASTGQGILGHNMFAYCGNNPVFHADTNGEAFETLFDKISLGTSIAEVVLNPADIWAWAGLIGDIADVAIPFVGGIGEAVDAMKVVADVVGGVDNVVDGTKAMKNAFLVRRARMKSFIRVARIMLEKDRLAEQSRQPMNMQNLTN